MQKYKVIYSVCKSLQQLACKHRNKISYSAYIVLESSYSQHTVKIIENMSTYLPKRWNTSTYSQIYWLMYITLICSCRKMENAPSSICHALHFWIWFFSQPLLIAFNMYATDCIWKPQQNLNLRSELCCLAIIKIGYLNNLRRTCSRALIDQGIR